MSVSNPAEAELKELVAKTLEEKGVLGKVKVLNIENIDRVIHMRTRVLFLIMDHVMLLVTHRHN